MDSSITGCFSSQRVSPVEVNLSPTADAISPEYTFSKSSLLFACICRIRPTRSFLFFVEFNIYEPVLNVPEYTLKNANLPTNGSAIILNANAENGSSSEDFLVTSLPFSSIPFISGISVGAGIYSIIASNSFCTPLLRYADPHNTGMISTEIVALLKAAFNSCSVGSSPSRYFSIRSSSVSQIASIIMLLYSSASSFISSGISVMEISSPLSSL